MGSDRGRDSGGLGKHLPGIFQGLIATALGTGLQPAVKLGWERLFPQHPLRDWAQEPLANLAGVIVLALAFWLLIWPVKRVMTRRMRATALAKGDRISIYVARFGDDDESRAARESVIASIRTELGPKQVEVLPAGVQLALTDGVSYEDAANEATSQARSLLKKKHGDLLIWGKLHTIAGNTVIELRFVSAAQDGSEGQRFGFTDKLTLEAGFGPEMGAALAAVAGTLALPAVQDRGMYAARILLPVANRLALLARALPPFMRPDDRAKLLHSHGLIQSVIGEQSCESSRLEEAVAAFREALKELTRDRVPLDWATTQNNLGNALARLGERESGTSLLEEAVAAFREALKERTQERVPLDWAMTQSNLGNALRSLGERESGTARLEEAVTAHREALKERTKDRVPLDWAVAQNNLVTAISSLGERESGTARIEEAVMAYREALKERTKDRVPLDWATTQNNLGSALRSLGERESGTTRLEEAVDAYREALKELTRDRVPLQWAMTQNNLGNALTSLGERESGTARLEEAVAAFREALKERTRERVPLQWATTQNNLGAALSSLGERESGTARLEEAVTRHHEALKEWTRERVPLQWAMTQNNLGNALSNLGERESGTARLKEAVAAYTRALEVFTIDSSAHYRSITLRGLEQAKRLLDVRKSQSG